VVFKLDSSGHETILHSFAGPPADGANPFAGLIRDSAGNLNGTTYFGGTSHFGVVFKLDSSGHETVLHSFAAHDDGRHPVAGRLVGDSAGNLYGTTSGGGASNFGVVFKLDSTGHETVLHSFAGPPADGGYPAGPIRDSAGNLYGTAQIGGASNKGVVFKLDSTGHETILYSFAGPPADGANPFAGLIRDSAGNLYGTTAYGGTSNFGVVFKLDSTGHETVLHSFAGAPADGSGPGELIRDLAGNLYGTTSHGGTKNFGVVFKLTP
jgi:uncharacterized repeat protein (TIGR03803 family)